MSIRHQFEIDRSLRSAVKTFFEKMSLCPPQPRRCLWCGQEMQYMNASFSLSGTDYLASKRARLPLRTGK
jgi:hypothetical protein